MKKSSNSRADTHQEHEQREGKAENARRNDLLERHRFESDENEQMSMVDRERLN